MAFIKLPFTLARRDEGCSPGTTSVGTRVDLRGRLTFRCRSPRQRHVPDRPGLVQPHGEHCQRLAGLLRHLRPLRRPCRLPPLWTLEQTNWYGLVRHRYLSGSFRERPTLRPLSQIAMRHRRLPVALPPAVQSLAPEQSISGATASAKKVQEFSIMANVGKRFAERQLTSL